MSKILASHINLYTSPNFYHFNLETPQRPFHNVHSEFSISLNITKHVCSLWSLLPNSTSHEVPHTSSPDGNLWRSAPIRELPRGAWLSDVIHHPTRYHDNTSAHAIYTSNIIIGCKSIIPSDIMIYNPYLLHMYMCAKIWSADNWSTRVSSQEMSHVIERLVTTMGIHVYIIIVTK